MAACKSRFVAAIYSDVRANSTIAADALKLVLLQNTKQRDLCLGRKLTDFIEEDRASVRQFESTQPLLSRARECPLLMAE